MPSKRRTKAPTHKLFNPLGTRGAAASKHATGEDNPALEMIWHAVAALPPGSVTTYGDVARSVGLPGRARQVGYALRVAPKGLYLPWHRVVGAGGKISFPIATREHKEQARRLKAEGVKVEKGRVARSALMMRNEEH